MTIGDDIFTILGMMPIRDRAGIQRATMADEAMKASGGNAEGQALTQQGQAPPPISLPPMGGPGDVQLPDDVPTAFAAGKSKVALPPPVERTIATSPAANPSPQVRRGSDMILAEIEKRKRQEDMNGLFASIALAASSLRGGGTGEGRGALIDQAFGGGKATSVAEMIALQNLRSSENEQAAKLAARERAIQHNMVVNKWDRERATYMVDSGNAEKFSDPKELRERQGIVELEQRKKRARELVPMIAKARGTDPAVLAAMAEKDPDAVVAMAESEKLVDLSKKKTDENMNQRKDQLEELDTLAYARHFKDPQALKDAYPDEDPARIDEALQSPTQYKEMMKELTGKGQTGPLDPLVKEMVDKQILPAKAKAGERASSNALENREMQNLWRKDLKVGSPYTSEVMYNLSKTWAKLTGEKLSEGTLATEKMMQQQVAGTLATLKSLGAGTGLSDADREYAMKAQGGFATTADTLKYLLFLKEKENNFHIAKHNAEVDKAGTGSRYIKNRADSMFKVDPATPNRFMREAIQKGGLDKLVEEAVRNGTEKDPAIRATFENDPRRGVGPGVFDHIVKEERARQGKK